jgi:drug/metabolite transporter (DMT)-like permease
LWTTIAILAAAITGLVSILDSHLISRRMPSIQAFMAPIGIIHFGVGILILALNPLPAGIGLAPIAVAIGAGIIRVAGAVPMLYQMRSEEVSRIMPVVNTFPIFVALMAVPLLGETLDGSDWLAIIMTVAGAMLISVHRDGQGQRIQFRRSALVLMASSVFFAVANVGGKYALDYVSFWSLYGISGLCLGGAFLLFGVRPGVFGQIRRMSERGKALGMLALNEGTAVGGFILSFWAIEQGPVSLVSAILSTRPAFVFLFAVAVSHFFPTALQERLTRGVILTKVVSIALVVGGVVMLGTAG